MGVYSSPIYDIWLVPGMLCEKSEALEEILGVILKEPVIHVDETGVKISGTQNGCIRLLTKKEVITCALKNGEIVKRAGQSIELYTGIVVHDHFSTYQGLLLCKTCRMQCTY